MTVTPRLRAVGWLVLGALVVACVLGWRAARPNLDPDTDARTAAGVTVLLYTEQYEGAIASDAYLEATLRVLPGGCLGVDSPVPALAVFPVDSDVLVRDGYVAVRVPTYNDAGRRDGGTVLSPGDAVTPSGLVGARPVSIKAFGGELADHVPTSCRQYPAQDVDAPYAP